ncbi:hypothetical protein [Streptomyces neyagawaensis]|nr:hypothetical protein [Streptomyces neyagawaensis]MDE1688485.1 hypothetical protein [Streptomyces neyagawaensis]
MPVIVRRCHRRQGQAAMVSVFLVRRAVGYLDAREPGLAAVVAR